MGPSVKFLIGLAAALASAAIAHGPLGQGEKLIGALEGQAKAAVAEQEVPGVSVSLSRDPLSRAATLSGPANDLQREGMGSLPGLNDVVSGIKGISSVRWADQPQDGERTLPLLAELLILAALAYAIGFALAWLLWGRARRQSYLD
jgi:hypothetical protein